MPERKTFLNELTNLSLGTQVLPPRSEKRSWTTFSRTSVAVGAMGNGPSGSFEVNFHMLNPSFISFFRNSKAIQFYHGLIDASLKICSSVLEEIPICDHLSGMSQHYDLNQAIHQVGQNSMSLAQLLNYFVDPSYQRGNLSRISDMHANTGRPVSFRIDDDLTPIPEGFGVFDEVIRYMLGVLLSEKHLSTALNEDQPEDVDTAFEWKEKGVNFRINVFRDRDGLFFVMRVLASNIPSIQEVGLPSKRFGKTSPV